jgi:SAM-dependent methyltransferase
VRNFRTDFEREYQEGTAPWVIGEPQPAVVALERDGWFRGDVLDIGCGTGANAVFLAESGHRVHGIDLSSRAIELARSHAAARGIAVEFAVSDALRLEGRYDTVLDSALFHVYGLDRADYVRSLLRVTAPGARVHLLALADVGPRYGPQISDQVIREAFGFGWQLEHLGPSTYRCRTGAGVTDAPAWLARLRRTSLPSG